MVVGEYVVPFEGEAEVNKARMDETAAFLASYKEDGTGFNVKRLIMPGHRRARPTPFTYATSTIINGLNLWPAYTFPDWEEQGVAESQWQDATMSTSGSTAKYRLLVGGDSSHHADHPSQNAGAFGRRRRRSRKTPAQPRRMDTQAPAARMG